VTTLAGIVVVGGIRGTGGLGGVWVVRSRSCGQVGGGAGVWIMMHREEGRVDIAVTSGCSMPSGVEGTGGWGGGEGGEAASKGDSLFWRRNGVDIRVGGSGGGVVSHAVHSGR